MKLPSAHTLRPRRHESGSAVIVVVALLAIIMMYVASNLRTLDNLEREVRLVERQQIHRLQAAARPTPSPPGIAVATNSIPQPLGNPDKLAPAAPQ